MQTFSEAFEAPVVETIRGQKVTFPILEIDDYSPWIAELVAFHKAEATKLMPIALKDQTRKEYEARINAIDVGMDNLMPVVLTVPGSRRVLEMSLKKSGMDDEGIARVLKAVRPGRLHPLAQSVSGLWDSAPIDLPQAAGSSPNV